ncbi:hypothetical protein BV20DRAFT_997085 [Pilatotrama ljubarskyi]|nr:hypothetical protein BV20DRAFT_997085 [Pilatotrama ljubarskyi]
MSAAALTSLAVVAVPLLAYIYKTFATNPKGSQPGAAYILENTVIHARLLPAPSTHAFTYPTLAFLLSLNALETHALDLGRGWLFGYGGTAWRLTGLRNGAYLLPDSYNPPRALSLPTDGRASHGVKSLKAKLAEVLVLQRVDERRVQQWAKEGDAWMLTMPSYVGYEGINPLTVYFCYASEGTLEWIVLEIHNTFGEKHVHVLEPGLNEDIECPPGHARDRYDYTWTLPRDFHVSPFNDRSGFYTISVSAPPPPLSPLLASSPPRPKIRIHLRTAVPSEPDTNPPTPGALKLAATLFARRAVPLTTAHLLRVLARYPFALLLSLARILYHAGILHYMKRLDVFPRPDPKPSAPARHALEGVSKTTENGGSHEEERVYGGIGWQPEGALEAYARKVVESFLARRAEELEIRILLVSGDPSIPPQLFPPSTRAGNMAVGQEDEPDLTICYAAPRFFTTLLLAPSSSYMLLLGHVEDLFRISSASLFSQVFSAAAPITQGSLTQRLRVWLLPPRFVGSASPSGVPLRHPLDGDRPLMNAVVICAMHLMDNVEKVVFTSLKARFVPGLAPWQRWERAARMADEGRT